MSAPPRRLLRWGFLGTVPYGQGVALQERLREELRTGRGPEHLLLLEHPPVFTLGRSASPADVLAAPGWLAERGIEIAECDRGGQVTFHGPGQLVGYPILDLNPDRRDLRRYVRDLQEALVRTLAEFGVAASGGMGAERIGVWVGGRKVASIGVHVSRWITTHGFALNVTTDLSCFRGIVPCGLAEVEMASVESLTGVRPPVAEVAGVCARELAAVFGRELEPFEATRRPPAVVRPPASPNRPGAPAGPAWPTSS
jgi:lipoyl(octanoyl) transferase